MTVAQEIRWKRKCIADFNAVSDRQIEVEAFAMPRAPRSPVVPAPSTTPTKRQVRAWMRLHWSEYETDGPLCLSRSMTMAKHPKCEGYRVETPNGTEYDCGYDTTITCDECRYCAPNNGRGKDPAAKCNQQK